MEHSSGVETRDTEKEGAGFDRSDSDFEFGPVNLEGSQAVMGGAVGTGTWAFASCEGRSKGRAFLPPGFKTGPSE